MRNMSCCTMTSHIFTRFAIKDFDKPYKWYNSIMALRVLWLKKNEPETWRLLDMLMDHAEVADSEDKMINGVVDFIVNVCKLNFTEKEVRHVMGIIDTVRNMLFCTSEADNFYMNYEAIPS